MYKTFTQLTRHTTPLHTYNTNFTPYIMATNRTPETSYDVEGNNEKGRSSVDNTLHDEDNLSSVR